MIPQISRIAAVLKGAFGFVTANRDPVTGGVGITAGGKSGVVPVSVPVGDGANSDHEAFAAAIDAAGVGGVIALMPGAKYVLDRRIILPTGLRLVGNGAVIKRPAQRITSTTSVITSGSTNQIVVADPSIFEVGQQINVAQGVNYGTQNVTIIDINGSLITTATSFVLSAGSPWSGTTQVFTAYDMISTSPYCTLQELEFDGNKANWAYARWENVSEVKALGERNVVLDCYIHDAPGEAITETASANFANFGNQYKGNLITGINGNGIHLSGSRGAQVIGNHIRNTNLQGASVGHNGGCVTISNGVVDLLVANNHLESGRAGVGQVDSSDNSRISITGNTVVNMSAWMLELRGYDANVTDVSVTGNRFHNDTAPAAAGLIAVDITDTNVGSISRVNVSANQFFNAGLKVGRLHSAAISGNCFETAYQAADTFHDSIRAATLTAVAITGNTTKNGNAGIALTGNLTDVVVTGNSLNKPYYYGIFAQGATNLNVLVANNGVSMDNNVNSSARGIVVGANVAARGNNINMIAGFCGIRVEGVANAVVQGNTVRGAGAGKSIRVETGSTGYVVVDNQVSHAVTDTPAVGVRVANNDVIV